MRSRFKTILYWISKNKILQFSVSLFPFKNKDVRIYHLISVLFICLQIIDLQSLKDRFWVLGKNSVVKTSELSLNIIKLLLVLGWLFVSVSVCVLMLTQAVSKHYSNWLIWFQLSTRDTPMLMNQKNFESTYILLWVG